MVKRQFKASKKPVQKKAEKPKSGLKIADSGFFSRRIGPLPRGCQLCVKGEKLVLFVTGLCPRNCMYCPISDRKHQHDVTYANEWPTSNLADIIQEAKLCGSTGAGFTGGDPLVKLHRTCAYIRALKEEFGKGFHIHLYTSFDLVHDANLKLLHDAGLDEIRFHADLDSDKLWHRIDCAKNFGWDVGVEIPVIPGRQKMTERLMKFMEGKINFLNLNELEVSDAAANRLSEKGFRTKDTLSYGVKGSESLAKYLLDFAVKNDLSYSIHYCTAKLKDAVQLSKRIARRAKNVKKPFDIMDKAGLLTRGAIYLPYLTPSKDTTDKLALLLPSKRHMLLKKLEVYRNHLMRTYDIPPQLLDIDPIRIRLLTNVKVVSELTNQIKKSGLKPSIVTEFPTWDALIVELDWV